jgi:hypothetical protein
MGASVLVTNPSREDLTQFQAKKPVDYVKKIVNEAKRGEILFGQSRMGH